MQTLLSHSQKQETVVIPTNLTTFLTEVHQLIMTGDVRTIQVSSDMLETECAYGGLLEENGAASEYSFIYFPIEGVDCWWEIVLDRTDIAKIAGGQQDTLTLWPCQKSGCVNKLTDANETCFRH